MHPFKICPRTRRLNSSCQDPVSAPPFVGMDADGVNKVYGVNLLTATELKCVISLQTSTTLTA